MQEKYYITIDEIMDNYCLSHICSSCQFDSESGCISSDVQDK